jgi:hypothetical protein
VPIEFHQIRFIVGTGDDDLLNDSKPTANLFLMNGQSFTVTLKDKNAGSGDNGSVSGPLNFNMPSTVTTLPTPSQALSGVQINLIQGGSFLETNDNWSIGFLQVVLFNPGKLELCQLDLVGTNRLLVRLKGSVPTSPKYSPGPSSGCRMKCLARHHRDPVGWFHTLS